MVEEDSRGQIRIMVNCSTETMSERQWNHINKDHKMGGIYIQ